MGAYYECIIQSPGAHVSPHIAGDSFMFFRTLLAFPLCTPEPDGEVYTVQGKTHAIAIALLSYACHHSFYGEAC